MSDDELPAAIEFVRKHGAATSRDVVDALVSKCDRLAIELEQANNTAATACKRFAEVSAELAELRAACEPFAECARAVDMYGNLNPMPR